MLKRSLQEESEHEMALWSASLLILTRSASFLLYRKRSDGCLSSRKLLFRLLLTGIERNQRTLTSSPTTTGNVDGESFSPIEVVIQHVFLPLSAGLERRFLVSL